MNDYSGLILDGLRLTRNSIYIEIKDNFTNIDNINESYSLKKFCTRNYFYINNL